MSAEKYLKPEVIRQISRLDLRAQFIVRGVQRHCQVYREVFIGEVPYLRHDADG